MAETAARAGGEAVLAERACVQPCCIGGARKREENTPLGQEDRFPGALGLSLALSPRCQRACGGRGAERGQKGGVDEPAELTACVSSVTSTLLASGRQCREGRPWFPHRERRCSSQVRGVWSQTDERHRPEHACHLPCVRVFIHLRENNAIRTGFV